MMEDRKDGVEPSQQQQQLSSPKQEPVDASSAAPQPRSPQDEPMERDATDNREEKHESEQEHMQQDENNPEDTKDAQDSKPADDEEEADDDDEAGEGEGEGGSGETRCVCGNTDEESYGFMIQCETCGCWQHGVCVGLVEEKYAPDTYYCEQCRPDMHPIVIPGRVLIYAFIPSTNTHCRRPGRKPARLTQQKKEPKQKSPATSQRRRSSSSNDTAERARSPKRRSTLNSRDAAYDDAIAASLLDMQNDNMKSQIAEREKMRWMQYGGQVTPSQQEEEDSEQPQSQPQTQPQPQPPKPVQPTEDAHDVPEQRDEGDEEEQPDNNETNDSENNAHTAHTSHTANSSDKGKEKDKESPKERPPPDSETDYKPRSRPESKGGRGRGVKRKDQGRNSTAAKARSKEKSVVNEEEEKNDNSKRSASPNSTAADEREQRAPSRVYKKRRRETDESNNEEGFTPPATANGPRRAGNGNRKDKHLQSPHKRKGGNKDKERKQMLDEDAALNWNLPDHLQHLSHMLPSEQPEMLALKVPRGTAMEVVEEKPTRVKFPSKRMTIAEMKRRVRSVLEYVGRVQIEAAERPAPEMQDGKAPESIQMLDNMTRELIRFNEKFSTSSKRRDEDDE
ncbi:hypothetical protein E3P99_00672 [Wallemia hederae]|uniref:PHD-type domain-containing protein n=1 Tax=Wallemia hederae TaxID=1540922 RepID=A0A4T0FU95_9BASI|nr:hypothetical protein E3P99_00672 [Wallemia hederae]